MATSPLEIISSDLDWREAELGSLKLLLARKDTTEHQKVVLLRACWALLYAHYEGFVKHALTVFFDRASAQASNCGILPPATRAHAFQDTIKRLRSLPSLDFLKEVETFSINHHTLQPSFPEVDTKSNLWPNVLEDLLACADIALPALGSHRIKINTLVKRRNSIAHGKREMIQEIDYYRTFESAIYDLMYELAFEIEDRLKRPPYS